MTNRVDFNERRPSLINRISIETRNASAPVVLFVEQINCRVAVVERVKSLRWVVSGVDVIISSMKFQRFFVRWVIARGNCFVSTWALRTNVNYSLILSFSRFALIDSFDLRSTISILLSAAQRNDLFICQNSVNKQIQPIQFSVRVQEFHVLLLVDEILNRKSSPFIVALTERQNRLCLLDSWLLISSIVCALFSVILCRRRCRACNFSSSLAIHFKRDMCSRRWVDITLRFCFNRLSERNSNGVLFGELRLFSISFCGEQNQKFFSVVNEKSEFRGIRTKQMTERGLDI